MKFYMTRNHGLLAAGYSIRGTFTLLYDLHPGIPEGGEVPGDLQLFRAEGGAEAKNVAELSQNGRLVRILSFGGDRWGGLLFP